MKAEYVQRGEILDYTNQTGKTIEAGEVVVFGNRIAVAGTTILEGETGTLHMTGVYRVPKKASEAIEAGADVYYTDAGFSAVAAVMAAATAGRAKAGEAEVAEKAAAPKNAVGYAVRKAEADDAMVIVNLK